MYRAHRLVAAFVFLALVAGCAGAGGGRGDVDGDAVKIGVLMPLTGTSAAAGQKTLEGVRLAAEIVNKDYPDIDLPLARGTGLPGLDGTVIELVSADSESDPKTGAVAAERLITADSAVALVGSYNSSVTKTASQRAERLQVPFVNGASSSPNLTERGLRYFFRTGPSDQTFAQTFFDFLDDLAAEEDASVQDIGILYENTEYGASAAAVTREVAEERGYRVACDVAHANGVADVSPQVNTIKSCDPDAVFQASYTPEAILFMRTFKQAGYTPNILAYGAGFADQSFFDAVGSSGEYIVARAAWALDAVQDRQAAVRVAKLFERKYGHAMDENSARAFTAGLTLFYAIDQAGSAEPAAIRQALTRVQLSPEQTIMPWDGVDFDENGQNALAKGIIVQYLDGDYRLVYPFDVATADLVWPPPSFPERG